MLFENINYLLWEWVSGEPWILSCSSLFEERSGWLLSGPVRDHSCQRLLMGEEGWRPRTSRCTLMCLQALADCLSARCKLGEATGSGRACREVGRLFFCRGQQLLGTYIHCVGMWATYYVFFSGEDRNLSFTWEFPMLWSNNKNPCSGQTNILVWPTDCQFATSGWETELRHALSWGCGKRKLFCFWF